jgi:putative DNA methylase
MILRKKLIEVALPLQAINVESLRRKQKAPKGWPTSFHKWWAQRPLAAARAVIFAQLVDDPSASPDLFPTEEEQQKERDRLFRIIEDLVLWDNSANDSVREKVHDEIWKSWRRACADNGTTWSDSAKLDPNILPPFWDPFSGSGSLPLSAQWLGVESYATDLNPVAVLINKALIEIPYRFALNPPVNPTTRDVEPALIGRNWSGSQGLAEDVRAYARWMREEASARIGQFYPDVKITTAEASTREDLREFKGETLSVVAWLWTRTVKSPNPAFRDVDVPLASTFVLSSKAGKEAFVVPQIEGNNYRFVVKLGRPDVNAEIMGGTKLLNGANFRCLMSGTPIPSRYIMDEGSAGRIGSRLMAIVAEGARGRVYLDPTSEHETVAHKARPKWKPDVEFFQRALGFRIGNYGMTKWSDLFTNRQLVSLTTFTDLVSEARERVCIDALAAGMSNDPTPLRSGGSGAIAYADAVSIYLACAVDRMVYYGSNLTTWLPKDNALRDCMPRQALAMTWDYAEGNPLGKSSGDIITCSKAVANYLEVATPSAPGHAMQSDAQSGIAVGQRPVISTDPPYFDNVGYADLSDYFYVWLRHSLRFVLPDLFATVSTPKDGELVATPDRHGGKRGAEQFFLDGMTKAMTQLSALGHPLFPITIYYAFKQAEDSDEGGTASTGWDTFLGAVIAAGLAISGTWPLRTEGEGRMRSKNSNALASSIVLVCRRRAADAIPATRREFVAVLQRELLEALRHLQAGNIAPVDLAQAAIGPGMAVFTRYAKVLDAQGNALSVREALALINETLDTALAEQEGDFDADSRWALAWFDQNGFAEGDYGIAETLSKAKNTSISALAETGILESRKGKVRLLKPDELPADWVPTTDSRVTHWETVHHLIRALAGGEAAAATLVTKLGSRAEAARELAYRLYILCERKKRAADALAYNSLVQSWPELTRLAQEPLKPLQPADSELNLT